MSRPDATLDLICLGRAGVDLYAEQIGSRLEDVASFARYIGGSSTNIACCGARLGLACGLITRVGDDHMGRFIVEQLRREGVDTRGVLTDPERLTALVVLGIEDRDTFPLIFFRERCADLAIAPADLDAGWIGSAKALLITGTHLSREGVFAASMAALDIADEHARRRVLDIDYRPVLWGLTGRGDGATRFVADEGVTAHLQGVLGRFDLVIGTEEEFHIAGGSTDTLEALRAVRRASGASLVLKRGPFGASVFEGAIPDTLDAGVSVAGVGVEVMNVLGAGDAFAAGFLSGWLRDAPLEECLTRANASGALVVSRHGCTPAMPSAEELDWYLANRADVPRPDTHPELAYLHRVTTRAGHWPSLAVLAFDHRVQLEEMAREQGADPARLPALKSLLLDATLEVVERRGLAGGGILCDERYGGATLARATGRRPPLWIGRPVERPRSRPLSFERSCDVGTLIGSWPIDHVVKCLVSYSTADESALREAQEARLLELWNAVSASGHELLLEIIPPEETLELGESLHRSLERLHDIGLRPDWWKLPCMRRASAERLDALLAARAPHCRGIVVLGLDAPIEELAEAFGAFRGLARVRGFAVGRSIFGEPARRWLAGESDAATLRREVGDNYERVIDAWQRATSSARAWRAPERRIPPRRTRRRRAPPPPNRCPHERSHPPTDDGAGAGASPDRPAHRARRRGAAAVRRAVGDLRSRQRAGPRRGAVPAPRRAADLARAERAVDGAHRERLRQADAQAADDGRHELGGPRREQHAHRRRDGVRQPSAGAAPARGHARLARRGAGAAGSRAPDDGTLNVNDCFRPVSSWFDRLTRPEQLITSLPRALSVLTDPELAGPATLCLPQDVQAEVYDYPDWFFAPRVHRPVRPGADPRTLDEVAALIARSSRPVIVAGGGVHYAFACERLAAFAETHGVPVVETSAGKGALPASHRLNAGGVGVVGSAAANAIVEASDLIIAIGTRLSDFTTGSRTVLSNARVPQVNINVAQLDAHKHGAVALRGDAGRTLEELEPRLAGWASEAAHLETLERAKGQWRELVRETLAGDGRERPSDAQVTAVLNEHADQRRDVLVVAAGSMPAEGVKLWAPEHSRGYHAEYGYSCMGYELAGGIGVKMADPTAEVFVVVGDGSYLMMNSEILTSVALGHKLVVLVLDNRGFGCIDRLQGAVGQAPFNNLLDEGTAASETYPTVDFAAHARALGAMAEHVDSLDGLAAALGRARSSERTYCISIDTNAVDSTGGGSWWQVGIPAVSTRPSVDEARRDWQDAGAADQAF